MIPVPDEMLMAYADGELTPEETTALEQLLRQDAALRARLEPFLRTGRHLSNAFAPVLREPVPSRLIAAIQRAPRAHRASATALPLAGLRETLAAAAAAVFPSGLSPAMAAGMAALVMVGAAGGWIAGRTTGGPSMIAEARYGLLASGPLAHALEANPSHVASDPDGRGTSVVPVLSFKTAGNSVCREYRIQTGGTRRDFAGLACRNRDGNWRVALHVETAKQPPTSPDAPYVTSTGEGVPAVDAFVNRIIAGESFDDSVEGALLKNGWNVMQTTPSPPQP